MIAPHTRAAAAATLAFCAALFAGSAVAADTMPSLPEAGAKASATAPDIGDLSGAGNAVGGVSPERIAKTLETARANAEPSLRGKLEQDVYSKYSRSVVLIVTPDALGSGTVLDMDGTILTNWHVVAGVRRVGVIFKPLAEGDRVKGSDAVEATVVRIDQIADLAIVKVAHVPEDIRPVAVGDSRKLKVGADVHAIGHPLGEYWSYTKGIVSQIRPGYDWITPEEKVKHHADVVQTQTPISPGNSGGPLLNDDGELVGVAAFTATEGALINFAIATTEVTRVLAATGDRIATTSAASVSTAPSPKAAKCEMQTLDAFRSKDGKALLFDLDFDCNGKRDGRLVVPDNKNEPILLGIDQNENGVFEAIYQDTNRDKKFDVVDYDTDEDNKTDLIGYDLDADLEPGRVELVKN
jgi:S1-C subfamily serine protease